MKAPRWLRELFDPPRYCSCGCELAIDAVAKHDRRTGTVSEYVWSVACPRIDLSFHADGSAQGNGYWRHGHQAHIDCGEPTWLDPAVRDDIVAQADDFGWCPVSATPSFRAAKLAEQ